MGWAPWQEMYCTSRPSSVQYADDTRGSMGAAANRWLTMRWLTTTSQSSKEMGVRDSISMARLVPASGNRSVAPSASAPSAPTTAASGS
jgi:hypothetical protein